MKKALAFTALAGISLATFGTALPASAAVETYPTTAPTFYYVGGNDTDYSHREASTVDRTPGFSMGVDDKAQRGMRLIVREAGSGRLLCKGETPVDNYNNAYCYETLVRLAPGKTKVEAVLTSPDGKQVSKTARLDLFVAPKKPTVKVVSYDSAKHELTVAGTGEPGAHLDVGQNLGDSNVHHFDAPKSGAWTATITRAEVGRSVTVAQWTGDQQDAATTPFDPEHPAPKIISRTHDGVADICISSDDWDSATILAPGGQYAAGGNRTGSFTTFTIPAPKGEASYTVVTNGGGRDSVTQTVIVNEGADDATPAPPTVANVQATATRATATITAEPGAVATVKDSAGKVVAVKMLGAKGTVDISMSIPAKSGGDYKVTQSLNGTVSDWENFRIVAG